MGDAEPGLIGPRLDDPSAAEQLAERFGDRVYRLALRISGVREDAEGAMEDALRVAARAIHSFTDESAFGSWIYRTVAHAAHQRRKERQPVDETALDDLVPPLTGDGHFAPMDDWSMRMDEPTLQEGLRAILIEAIDALPSDYRTALILQDVEGASKPDIAEIIGVDVPEVKSRVHRARLFVRKRLSEYFESTAAA